jgi:hypothetical protein
MTGFLGRPTRGGRLTIANCLLWAIIMVALATKQTALVVVLVVTCWWPIAWLFIMPNLGGRRDDPSAASGLIIASVAIGVNSLLWGYGISWVLSAWFGPASAEPRPGCCPACGRDLRATPGPCSECGPAAQEEASAPTAPG